jgi:hypothetical protein
LFFILVFFLRARYFFSKTGWLAVANKHCWAMRVLHILLRASFIFRPGRPGLL